MKRKESPNLTLFPHWSRWGRLSGHTMALSPAGQPAARWTEGTRRHPTSGSVMAFLICFSNKHQVYQREKLMRTTKGYVMDTRYQALKWVFGVHYSMWFSQQKIAREYNSIQQVRQPRFGKTKSLPQCQIPRMILTLWERGLSPQELLPAQGPRMLRPPRNSPFLECMWGWGSGIRRGQHFTGRSQGGRDVSLKSSLVRADGEYMENYNQTKRTNQSSRSLRRTRGTLANPSTRWHAGPLSSAVTGDVMPWKNTAYISPHILPSFTITDSVPFPQSQGLDVGVLRSLGKGRGCGLT